MPHSGRGQLESVTFMVQGRGRTIDQKNVEIVALLKEHGVAVRLLRSKNPGKIVYEDDFQIVVREWKRL